MKAKYRLEQFGQVLNLRNRDNAPYLLIGGQAVNYWASRYLEKEPLLGELSPFTSEDIDFKGDRGDVESMARQLKLQPNFPSPVGMTALVGSIPFRSGDIDSNIEVVRSIPGAPKNVEQTAIEIEFEGMHLRVLDPISLLAAKLALFATVPQENRQDGRHIRILIPCVRQFLSELLHSIEDGELTARDWLKIARYLLKQTATKRALRAAKVLEVNWSQLLPWEVLKSAHDPRLIRFREAKSSSGR